MTVDFLPFQLDDTVSDLIAIGNKRAAGHYGEQVCSDSLPQGLAKAEERYNLLCCTLCLEN